MEFNFFKKNIVIKIYTNNYANARIKKKSLNYY